MMNSVRKCLTKKRMISRQRLEHLFFSGFNFVGMIDGRRGLGVGRLCVSGGVGLKDDGGVGADEEGDRRGPGDQGAVMPLAREIHGGGPSRGGVFDGECLATPKTGVLQWHYTTYITIYI